MRLRAEDAVGVLCPGKPVLDGLFHDADQSAHLIENILFGGISAHALVVGGKLPQRPVVLLGVFKKPGGVGEGDGAAPHHERVGRMGSRTMHPATPGSARRRVTVSASSAEAHLRLMSRRVPSLSVRSSSEDATAFTDAAACSRGTAPAVHQDSRYS